MMLKCGFEEEVEKLLSNGYDETLKSMRSIGYSHMVKKVKGEWSYETMTEKLTRDTRRYAKRQYTWFNRMEEIKWFHPGAKDKIEALVEQHIKDVDTGS
jgi:tRNA dimethylallyltransferase